LQKDIMKVFPPSEECQWSVIRCNQIHPPLHFWQWITSHGKNCPDKIHLPLESITISINSWWWRQWVSKI